MWVCRLYFYGRGMLLCHRPPEACPVSQGVEAAVEGTRVDMWGVGMLAIDVMTCHALWKILEKVAEPKWSSSVYPAMYKFLKKKELRKRVKKALPNAMLDKETLKSMRNFVLCFLRLDPDLRPTAEQAMSHEFLRKGSFRISEDPIWKKKAKSAYIETAASDYHQWLRLKNFDEKSVPSWLLECGAPVVYSLGSGGENFNTNQDTSGWSEIIPLESGPVTKVDEPMNVVELQGNRFTVALETDKSISRHPVEFMKEAPATAEGCIAEFIPFMEATFDGQKSNGSSQSVVLKEASSAISEKFSSRLNSVSSLSDSGSKVQNGLDAEMTTPEDQSIPASQHQSLHCFVQLDKRGMSSCAEIVSKNTRRYHSLPICFTRMVSDPSALEVVSEKKFSFDYRCHHTRQSFEKQDRGFEEEDQNEYFTTKAEGTNLKADLPSTPEVVIETACSPEISAEEIELLENDKETEKEIPRRRRGMRRCIDWIRERSRRLGRFFLRMRPKRTR